MTNEERMKRWRLILGSQSQETFDDMGGISLTAAIYGLNEGFEGERGSGNGPSAPRLARWLGDLRTLFDKDLVTVIQNDAIERKGLKQLLLEPEMLEHRGKRTGSRARNTTIITAPPGKSMAVPIL